MKVLDIIAIHVLVLGLGVIGISVFHYVQNKPALNAPTLEQRVRELDARIRVLEGQSKSTNFYMPVGRRTYGTKQTT